VFGVPRIVLVLSAAVLVLELILELLLASELFASSELPGGGVLIVVLQTAEQFSGTIEDFFSGQWSVVSGQWSVVSSQ
jgi:hypothetical protein